MEYPPIYSRWTMGFLPYCEKVSCHFTHVILSWYDLKSCEKRPREIALVSNPDSVSIPPSLSQMCTSSHFSLPSSSRRTQPGQWTWNWGQMLWVRATEVVQKEPNQSEGFRISFYNHSSAQLQSTPRIFKAPPIRWFRTISTVSFEVLTVSNLKQLILVRSRKTSSASRTRGGK